MTYRVVLTRLHGDGTETVIADEVPLTDPRVMVVLSGAGGVTGTITPEVARLQGGRAEAEAVMLAITGGTHVVRSADEPIHEPGTLWVHPDGTVRLYDENQWEEITNPDVIAAARRRDEPLLIPGRTGVYVLTEHGHVLGGGILSGDTSAHPNGQLRLDAVGHAGYLEGQPYSGDRSWIGVDPAFLIRHAWYNVQTRPGHDLGVTVDVIETPVTLGTEEREVSFQTGSGEQVDFDAGPFRWAWWQTHNLGREVDTLATDTPIEYVTVHRWDGQTFHHRLRLAHPRLGARRHDLTFVVGVNITVEPVVGTADDVSDVIVLGAGEGSEQRRGSATRSTGGLGRTVAIIDKSLTSHERCRRAAAAYLARMSGGHDVDRVVIHDHPNAPFGSWSVGDEIRLQGDGTGWAGDLNLWVRILSAEIQPDTRTATLTVTRAERT